MEAIVLLGGVIVGAAACWTISDLLQDHGIEPKLVVRAACRTVERFVTRTPQRCSDLRSRDISSSTACRAGLSQCRIL